VMLSDMVFVSLEGRGGPAVPLSRSV